MTLWIEIGNRTRKVELPASFSSTDKDLAGEMTCLIDGHPFPINARMLAQGLLSLLLPNRTESTTPAVALQTTSQFRCILDTSSEGQAVLINGQRFPFSIADPRSLSTRRHAGSGADGPKAIKAPMPGRVLRIMVAVGDLVAANQGLIVLEAMKMQNELKSPKAGRIERIAAQPGDTIQSGDVLLIVG